MSKAELVNHPKHYGGDTPYETIKVLKAWLTPEQYEGFLLGNTIKYLSRIDRKGGAESSTDLGKAEWYLKELIKERQTKAKLGIDQEATMQDSPNRNGTPSTIANSWAPCYTCGQTHQIMDLVDGIVYCLACSAKLSEEKIGKV